MLRFETAGESHGECLVATLQGLPAGIPISLEAVNRDLWRRQQGYGRGGRMKIETDRAEIVAGVRHSHTIGSPVAILIRNKDTKEPQDEDADPIYGKAIYETWRWLNESQQLVSEGTVDFGINAMNARVNALRTADASRLEQVVAPAADAPVLLPAHLDLLCQTSPRPTPEPEIVERCQTNAAAWALPFPGRRDVCPQR